MWGKFTYLEIVAPEKIVFVNSFADPEGHIVRAPFGDAVPLEIRNAVTLSESDGRTAITLRSAPINATEEEISFFKGMFESMTQGYGGTFDQLAERLAQTGSEA